MSETETQRSGEGFPLMVIKMTLAVIALASMIAYLGGKVGEDSAQRKAELMASMISEFQQSAKVSPERFAAYRMDSLQCTLDRYSLELYELDKMSPPIRCQVEDKNGRRLDFSKAFIKEIIEIRMPTV